MEWSKDLFSKYIKIIEDGKVVFFIKNHPWSSFASVELDGEKYGFYKNGFFTNKVSISHIPSGISVGSIEHRVLDGLVRVKYKDENYNWKKKSFFSNMFYLRKGGENLITYAPKFSDGEIYTEVEDKLLVATGMYIFLNHTISTAVIIIIMIIIMSANS